MTRSQIHSHKQTFLKYMPKPKHTHTHTHTYIYACSYWIYIGYDVGDMFFDNNANIEAIYNWFDAQVASTAAKNSINVTLVVTSYYNELKKPGPMFNFLSAAAVADGADYVYRVNDDTEFKTPWAVQFVAALKQLQPSNFGVVGPLCREGHDRILTHDFVHRCVEMHLYVTYVWIRCYRGVCAVTGSYA